MKDESSFVSLDKDITAMVSASASVWPFGQPVGKVGLRRRRQKGHEGDLVLVRVSQDNGWNGITLQNAFGRTVSMYPDHLFVGVLGLRQSTEHVMGSLPSHPIGPDDHLSLLSAGGVVGTTVFAPPRHGPVATLDLVGFLTHGRDIANLSLIRPPKTPACPLPPVILVTGTATGVGKTTLTCRIIHTLSQMPGQSVGTIMLSGSGGKEDTLAHRAAGARFFHSFIETGLCNSYGCAPLDYVSRVDDLCHRMAAQEKPSVIVGEMGGDLIFGNNEVLLRQSCLMPATVGLFVVSHDALGVLGSAHILNTWGVRAPLHPVVSWTQNLEAMRLRFRRFSQQEPIDPDDGEALARTLSGLLLQKKRLHVTGG